MRILHVIDRMDPKMGGVSQAVRTMVAGLRALSNENEVTSLDDPGASFLADLSFPIHALGPGRSPWSYSSKLIPWFLENLSRFDVVIVHGLWLYHTYAVRKALKTYKQQKGSGEALIPKIFVMPHGMLDPYFQKAVGRRMKALRNHVYWQVVEKNVVNDADGLLFTCEEECALARSPFHPYKPKKEIVVGLGVEDPPRYSLQMSEAFFDICPQVQHSPFLLFISRLDTKKGVDLLIEAYSKVFNGSETVVTFSQTSGTKRDSGKAEVEAGTPKLVIAGPGLETEYGQGIQRLIAERELTSSVFFTGMLTGNAKWGAFYNSDAFVLPSHQENFGIAVVEALACSKPVLISNKINIFREIQAGGGGYVADDTLEGVIQLLSFWKRTSLHDKEEMAKRSRNVYFKNFAVAPVAKQLMASLV